MRSGKTIVMVLACAAVIAACGENVENEMNEAALEEQIRPEPVDTVTAAQMANELVEATLNEWSIQLSRSEMPAGQVTFRIRNAGQIQHDFEIERAEGGDIQGDPEVEGEIMPGQERLLNVTLESGTYTIYCEEDSEQGDHDELGERVTFTVR